MTGLGDDISVIIQTQNEDESPKVQGQVNIDKKRSKLNMNDLKFRKSLYKKSSQQPFIPI